MQNLAADTEIRVELDVNEKGLQIPVCDPERYNSIPASVTKLKNIKPSDGFNWAPSGHGYVLDLRSSTTSNRFEFTLPSMRVPKPSTPKLKIDVDGFGNKAPKVCDNIAPELGGSSKGFYCASLEVTAEDAVTIDLIAPEDNKKGNLEFFFYGNAGGLPKGDRSLTVTPANTNEITLSNTIGWKQCSGMESCTAKISVVLPDDEWKKGKPLGLIASNLPNAIDLISMDGWVRLKYGSETILSQLYLFTNLEIQPSSFKGWVHLSEIEESNRYHFLGNPSTTSFGMRAILMIELDLYGEDLSNFLVNVTFPEGIYMPDYKDSADLEPLKVQPEDTTPIPLAADLATYIAAYDEESGAFMDPLDADMSFRSECNNPCLDEVSHLEISFDESDSSGHVTFIISPIMFDVRAIPPLSDVSFGVMKTKLGCPECDIDRSVVTRAPGVMKLTDTALTVDSIYPGSEAKVTAKFTADLPFVPGEDKVKLHLPGWSLPPSNSLKSSENVATDLREQCKFIGMARGSENPGAGTYACSPSSTSSLKCTLTQGGVPKTVSCSAKIEEGDNALEWDLVVTVNVIQNPGSTGISITATVENVVLPSAAIAKEVAGESTSAEPPTLSEYPQLALSILSGRVSIHRNGRMLSAQAVTFESLPHAAVCPTCPEGFVPDPADCIRCIPLTDVLFDGVMQYPNDTVQALTQEFVAPMGPSDLYDLSPQAPMLSGQFSAQVFSSAVSGSVSGELLCGLSGVEGPFTPFLGVAIKDGGSVTTLETPSDYFVWKIDKSSQLSDIHVWTYLTSTPNVTAAEDYLAAVSIVCEPRDPDLMVMSMVSPGTRPVDTRLWWLDSFKMPSFEFSFVAIVPECPECPLFTTPSIHNCFDCLTSDAAARELFSPVWNLPGEKGERSRITDGVSLGQSGSPQPLVVVPEGQNIATSGAVIFFHLPSEMLVSNLEVECHVYTVSEENVTISLSHYSLKERNDTIQFNVTSAWEELQVFAHAPRTAFLKLQESNTAQAEIWCTTNEVGKGLFSVKATKLPGLNYTENVPGAQLTVNALLPLRPERFTIPEFDICEVHRIDGTAVDAMTAHGLEILTSGSQNVTIAQSDLLDPSVGFFPTLKVLVKGIECDILDLDLEQRAVTFVIPPYSTVCTKPRQCEAPVSLELRNPLFYNDTRGGRVVVPSIDYGGFGVQFVRECVAYPNRNPEVCRNASHPDAATCPYGEADQCRPCPRGALCPGGFRAWPLPGYWSATGREDPIRCPDPATRCLGWWRLAQPPSPSGARRLASGTTSTSAGTGTVCDAGYEGYACTVCSEGYYPLKNLCKACPPPDDVWGMIAPIVVFAVVILLLLIGMFLIVWFAQKKRGGTLMGAATTAGQFVAWVVAVFQLMVQVVADASVGLPDTIRQIYVILDVFRLNFQFVHPECLSGDPFFLPMSTMLVALTCFAVFLSLVLPCSRPESCCGRCCGSRQKDPLTKLPRIRCHSLWTTILCRRKEGVPNVRVFRSLLARNITPTLHLGAVVVLSLLYAISVQSALDMLNCQQIDITVVEDGQAVAKSILALSKRLDVECFAADHAMPAALAVLTLLCIGAIFPLLSAFLVLWNAPSIDALYSSGWSQLPPWYQLKAKQSRWCADSRGGVAALPAPIAGAKGYTARGKLKAAAAAPGASEHENPLFKGSKNHRGSVESHGSDTLQGETGGTGGTPTRDDAWAPEPTWPLPKPADRPPKSCSACCFYCRLVFRRNTRNRLGFPLGFVRGAATALSEKKKSPGWGGPPILEDKRTTVRATINIKDQFIPARFWFDQLDLFLLLFLNLLSLFFPSSSPTASPGGSIAKTVLTALLLAGYSTLMLLYQPYHPLSVWKLPVKVASLGVALLATICNCVSALSVAVPEDAAGDLATAGMVEEVPEYVTALAWMVFISATALFVVLALSFWWLVLRNATLEEKDKAFEEAIGHEEELWDDEEDELWDDEVASSPAAAGSNRSLVAPSQSTPANTVALPADPAQRWYVYDGYSVYGPATREHVIGWMEEGLLNNYCEVGSLAMQEIPSVFKDSYWKHSFSHSILVSFVVADCLEPKRPQFARWLFPHQRLF